MLRKQVALNLKLPLQSTLPEEIWEGWEAREELGEALLNSTESV